MYPGRYLKEDKDTETFNDPGNIQDPGNLGTIIRAGEGAGITGVVMSSDTADIYNPKVIRSTMGAVFRMPFLYVEDLPEKIKELQKKSN